MDEILALLADPDALGEVVKNAYVNFSVYLLIAGNMLTVILRLAQKAALKTPSKKDDEVLEVVTKTVEAVVGAVAKSGAPTNKALGIVLKVLFPLLPRGK